MPRGWAVRPSRSRPGDHAWEHKACNLVLREPPTLRMADGVRWHVQVEVVKQLIENFYMAESCAMKADALYNAFEDCMSLRRGAVAKCKALRKGVKEAMEEATEALEEEWSEQCDELCTWLEEAEGERGRMVDAAGEELKWPQMRVRAVARMLEQEGRIYSTIDDDHFAVLA